MENCIFCKIANGVIPSVTLYEDEDFRVIFDISPASRGHVLILPKQHAKNVCDLPEELAQKVLPLAARIGRAQMKALSCDGFNLVQNNGEAAGQTVEHFHMHVIPRYQGDEQILLWNPHTSDGEELKELAEQIGKEM